MQLFNWPHCSFSNAIFSSNLQLMLRIGWLDFHLCEGVPFPIPGVGNYFTRRARFGKTVEAAGRTLIGKQGEELGPRAVVCPCLSYSIKKLHSNIRLESEFILEDPSSY